MGARKELGAFVALRSTYWRDDKTRPLSMAARGLWASLSSMCSDQRNDGRFHRSMLHAVFLGAPIDEPLVTELVNHEWLSADGDYLVMVNYTKHNPSNAEIGNMAAGARKRKADYRAKGTPETLSQLCPTGQLSDTETCPTGQRSDPEHVSHGTSLLDKKRREEIEIRREEKRSEENAYASRVRASEPANETSHPPKPALVPEPEFSLDDVAQVFAEERLAAGGEGYVRQHSHYNSLEDARATFVDCAKRLKIKPIECARRSARNYCAEPWARKNKLPIGAWLKDPAKNLSEAIPEPPPEEPLPWIARNVG